MAKSPQDEASTFRNRRLLPEGAISVGQLAFAACRGGQLEGTAIAVRDL
jgi:hypothetical protein